MAFSYVGNFPNQQVSNSGVLSLDDINNLESTGELGGSLELIEEKSISGVSSAIFTSIKQTKYDVHFLEIKNYQPVSDSTDMRIRFYESGVEESASVYQYAFEYMVSTGSRQEVQSTGESYLRATFNTGNATNEKGHSYNYFYNLGNSSKYSFQTTQTVLIQNNGNFNIAFGSGVLPQASEVDQIKLFNGSGNFSCTAKLYGIKQI